MKTFRLLPLALLLALAGCSNTYYNAMEKMGVPKREILVNRVDETRQSQTKAKEQFASALDHFLAVTKVDGPDLKDKYDDLAIQLKRSEARAKEVNDRIAAVEDVAAALFIEWKQELDQYASDSLRKESQREFDATQRRYTTLIHLMHRAADRMEPVLQSFRDQVLFLKHNLNARAVASLDTTSQTLNADVTRLIADMEASIHEAEAFIKNLAVKPAMAQ